ncbi:peroxiredoxin Q/BCP [Pseudohyphozyma bogoriensis]|nr:peroxiredoxin Q/BCP [Pseudohyphozyma bogoriensis]
MPPKPPSSEPTRRSSRTSTSSKPASAASAPSSKSKASASAAKPSSKRGKGRAKSAATVESDAEEEVGGQEEAGGEEDKGEPEEEAKDEGEPATKKAKTASVLSIGDVVPDITLKNEDDEDLSLKELYDKTGLVIFSYPKANTPGCTTQACGFRDIHSQITDKGFSVYGLSADGPKAQLSWKTKHSFGYSLLSDPKRELLKQLGATDAKKRCHWVIEKGGKLLEAAIGVKPADDPSNALKFISAL